MIEIDWKKIGLSDNPFLLTPPESPDTAMWAGVAELKKQFESILSEAKGSALNQVILCRGPVGGGKTHASIYFSNPKNWPNHKLSVRDSLVWKINTPKETGKPDRDFYINLMEYIGMDHMRPVIASNIDLLGYESAQDILRKTTESADITKAILMLGADPDNELIDSYFLGKPTRAELKKLKLTRALEKNQDYFRVLAGVIRCYTGLDKDMSVSKHSRICLWIDEMEDFVYFTPAQYRSFGQGLRDLIDRVPGFFSTFFNFTLSTGEESEEIELILGKALVDRVTNHVFFQELDHGEMLRYVAEVLRHHRMPAFDAPNEYYPFEEQSLHSLLTDLQRRTPRDVNKRCRNAIVRAFQSGLFQSNGQVTIAKEFVKKLNLEELDRELG